MFCIFQSTLVFNIRMNNDNSQSLGGQLSRNDLLSWINSLTHLNLSKVEQLGTGVAYCQIVDMLQPGRIQLSKISPKAKAEYEFITNFKLLQQCFTKLGIYKDIEIEKLVKCKYQDNLQFLQWFHKYFEGQVARKDSLNSSARKDSGHRRSLSRKGTNAGLPHNISKIQKKQVDNGSFEEVLDDLGKSHSNSQEDLTQFYKQKLFEIHELVDSWDAESPSGQLRNRIEQILLRPPPEVLLRPATQMIPHKSPQQ